MGVVRYKWLIVVASFAILIIGPAVYLASDLGGYGYPQGQKEGSLQTPLAMQGTEIIDKRGSQIPLDIKLTNHLGQVVVLGEYLKNRGTPKLLTLGYYECPMLCNLVLNGLVDSLKSISLEIGKDFDVLSVSINPAEQFVLAAKKRENYLAAASISADDTVWPFNIASESEVKRLADAVGFGYRWDDSIKQFAHAAGVFVIAPDGTLSRTLYGIEYKSSDVKFSLMEASAGRVGSLMDRIILTCFHYDPDSHKYGVYIFGLMRIGGLATIVVLSTVLAVLWRRDRRRLIVNS